MLYTHPSSRIFEPSECIPFSEINSNVKACCHCLEAALNAWASFSAHPDGSLFLKPSFHLRLFPQSQSLTLSIHRRILIRLLSQTTPLALNIPVQRQQKHACKRFHDFRLWQEARGQCAYVSRHSFSTETCSGRQGALWLTQDRGSSETLREEELSPSPAEGLDWS